VLLIGRSTRLARYVSALDKEYEATARFGAVSDTLDAEGEVTALENTSMPSEPDLLSALPRFTGELLQVPPMASAIKVGGTRLYDLHRQGRTVERDPRPVTIHSFELTDHDPESHEVSFRIRCSSGTYIRTLIADLAASLDTGAYLTTLRRTRVGHLSLHKVLHLHDLTHENLKYHIIQPREVLAHIPSLEIDEEEAKSVRSGRLLRTDEAGSFRVECGGELLAVYRGDGEEARAEVVLCGG
jgi:tRNA pseudouridine55 synthase